MARFVVHKFIDTPYLTVEKIFKTNDNHGNVLNVAVNYVLGLDGT